MVSVDTLVLIAGIIRDHDRHNTSPDLLSGLNSTAASCSSGALAEFNAVISRLPMRRAIQVEQATLLINDIASRSTIVLLIPSDYLEMLTGIAAEGNRGGQTYDALHIKRARKVTAEKITTSDAKHFQAIAPNISNITVTP